MTVQRWTNREIRKYLGERGFLQDGDTIEVDNGYYTTFVRGEDELTLLEFKDESEPAVFQNGQQVVVGEIGFRNEQIQHKPLLGD